MCVSPPSTMLGEAALAAEPRSQYACQTRQGHCSFSQRRRVAQASRVPAGSLPPPPRALALWTPHLVLLGGTHTVPRLVSWWLYRHRCPHRRGRAF